MKSIEVSGKTVEEAVKAGIAQLGCDYGDVNVDVLEMGRPGLFGMFGKLAKVRLTVKEDDPDLSFDMPVMSLDETAKASKKKSEPTKPAAEKAETQVSKSEETNTASNAQAATAEAEVQTASEDAAEEAGIAPRQRPNRVERSQPAQELSEPTVLTPMEVVPDLPPLDESILSEDGKKTLDFLRNVTKLMGVEVEIRVGETEGQITVQMFGDTLGVLIGRRGETLDALQYLTSLTVNRGRNDYTRISLDTEHYRAKREEALRKLALRMANRARKTGRRVALEPMNPYERRVLHSALQNDPHVTTHSEGEEPYRRVIITLK